MNTKHLEFFKNSYYKWLNERDLDIAHVYLFTLQSLCSIYIKSFKVTYFVSLRVASCDRYNILVYGVMFNDFILL